MKKEMKNTSSPMESIIYDEVMKLSHQYFGSDAPKCISKFMKAHLQKDPRLATIEDFIGLTDWVKVLASFLEDDKEVIDQFMADFQQLLTMSW